MNVLFVSGWVSHLGNLRLRARIQPNPCRNGALGVWYTTVALFVAPTNTLFLKEDFGNEK